jgi:hypothetical protein
VGTVSAPALLGGLVDLNVLDDQVAGVETLGVGVGLSVLEETEKNLGGLDGPAGTGDTHGLACENVSLLQHEHMCSWLLRVPIGPSSSRASVCVCVEFWQLTLRSASSSASVPPHGDGLLVLQDISEVGERALKLPAVDGLGGLAGVLEGNAEVAAARAGRLCALDAGCCVANLH